MDKKVPRKCEVTPEQKWCGEVFDYLETCKDVDVEEVSPFKIEEIVSQIRADERKRVLEEVLGYCRQAYTAHVCVLAIEKMLGLPLKGESRDYLAHQLKQGDGEKREVEITLEMQNRIRDHILSELRSSGIDADIDGSGCDSGDPMDLTLSEISQGMNAIHDYYYEQGDGEKRDGV